MMKAISFILCILAFLQLTYISDAKAEKNEHAVLYIDREVEHVDSFIIFLDGDWEFYWQEFKNYNDFYDKQIDSALIVKVPSYWTDYVVDSKKPFEGKGYATYRKKIYMPSSHSSKLGLQIPVFDDAYQLYIDSFLISEAGVVAKSEKNSNPEYDPAIEYFEVKRDSFDIIVHVSNYNHRRGGFWKYLILGTENEILNESRKYGFLSVVSIGMLFAFSLFFVFFFIFYRKNYISLFFSLFLSGILLRLIATDTYPLLLYNPSWENLIRMEYIGSFIALTAGMWYFYALFRQERILKLFIVISLLNILSIVFVIITRPALFSYIMLYFQPVSLLLVIYFLIRSFISALKGKTEHIMFFCAILVFTLALINDILLANSRGGVTHNYIIHFGVQIFVFIQSLIIIRQWILAYKEKEKLNSEIEFLNKNLENRVEERTGELNNRNEKIQKQNLEIESKNRELQRGIQFNQKLLSIIAHDLKSPVTSLFQISDYLYKSRKDSDLREIFGSIRQLSDSAYGLIDNLLYWGRSQGNRIKVNKKKVEIFKFLKELYDFFNETAKQKNVELSINASDKLVCIADYNLLLIIVRNLVSNAIKFTPEGGKVSMEAYKEEKKAVIVIQDNGKGIPEKVIKEINRGNLPQSGYGTANEKGSGLGLSLCYELIKIHKGEIELSSREGEGTTAKIYFSSRS
jgi:signal transduction histidine kinase